MQTFNFNKCRQFCFGGGKVPDVPAPPPPAPIPSPSDVAPQQTADQRANATKQLQYGILSTIKTGGGGLTGQGPDLNAPTATAGIPQKKTLGGS